MTHPMLEKVIKATSGWALRVEGDGYRVQYGCVVHGTFHRSRDSAMEELETSRARSAIQALLEPDEGMVDCGHDELCNYTTDVPEQFFVKAYRAMLLPLVEGDGK